MRGQLKRKTPAVRATRPQGTTGTTDTTGNFLDSVSKSYEVSVSKVTSGIFARTREMRR